MQLLLFSHLVPFYKRYNMEVSHSFGEPLMESNLLSIYHSLMSLFLKMQVVSPRKWQKLSPLIFQVLIWKVCLDQLWLVQMMIAYSQIWMTLKYYLIRLLLEESRGANSNLRCSMIPTLRKLRSRIHSMRRRSRF